MRPASLHTSASPPQEALRNALVICGVPGGGGGAVVSMMAPG